MFHKHKSKNQKSKQKTDYDLSYDNLAIPEIHTHEIHKETDKENAKEMDSPAGQKDVSHSVNYESVAIPEIHIHQKK